jgi:hypothetical protein
VRINGRDFAPRPPAGDTRRRGGRRGDPLASPPDREGHAPYGRAKAATRYERAESSPLTTAADTDGELLRISGRPDTITLSAQAFGAIFTFVDFVGRTITELHVPAGDTQETYTAADRVLVRNAVAASAAIVMAVAKWAEPYEAT